MPRIMFGHIDVTIDDHTRLLHMLSANVSVQDLVPTLIRENASSVYIESRIKDLEERGDYILIDDGDPYLPHFIDWMMDARDYYSRPRFIDAEFIRRFGDDEFYANLDMLEDSVRSLDEHESHTVLIPKSDANRWRYDELAEFGTLKRGTQIPIEDRLAVFPAPALKAIAKGRSLKGISKPKDFIMGLLEADPVFRRVIDAHSNNFFAVPHLGFDLDDFRGEYSIWAAMAGILLHHDKVEPDSHLR